MRGLLDSHTQNSIIKWADVNDKDDLYARCRPDRRTFHLFNLTDMQLGQSISVLRSIGPSWNKVTMTFYWESTTQTSYKLEYVCGFFRRLFSNHQTLDACGQGNAFWYKHWSNDKLASHSLSCDYSMSVVLIQFCKHFVLLVTVNIFPSRRKSNEPDLRNQINRLQYW